MQSSKSFEAAIASHVVQFPGHSETLTVQGVHVAREFLLDRLYEKMPDSDDPYVRRCYARDGGSLKKAKRLETLRGFAYNMATPEDKISN